LARWLVEPLGGGVLAVDVDFAGEAFYVLQNLSLGPVRGAAPLAELALPEISAVAVAGLGAALAAVDESALLVDMDAVAHLGALLSLITGRRCPFLIRCGQEAAAVMFPDEVRLDG
jgi:hypothetical protein